MIRRMNGSGYTERNEDDFMEIYNEKIRYIV